MHCYETEHYVFHYESGSKAEQCSLSDVEKDFFQYIDLLTYDQAVYARIEDLLKEEQRTEAVASM